MKSEEELREYLDKNAGKFAERKFFGMSYEEGVEQTIQWIPGEIEEDPMG